jgi:hypothetical protein
MLGIAHLFTYLHVLSVKCLKQIEQIEQMGQVFVLTNEKDVAVILYTDNMCFFLYDSF